MSKTCPDVSLALQGGGAHGAFTWGVLDRLLEEVERGAFRIAAISGTSAGAMNAAVCASALAAGPAAAREALERFWTGVYEVAAAVGNPYLFVPYNAAGQGWNFDPLPLSAVLSMVQQVWSPYLRIDQWSPFHQPSLRDVVGRLCDFEALNTPKGGVPALYVAATDVGKGARKVFGPGELSADALLASACLPNVERAVKIGDSHYWDGGFTANPALQPLCCHAGDMIIVQLNPAGREGEQPPRTAAEIADRVNEITFNLALVQEINTIETVNRLLEHVPAGTVGACKVNLHLIADAGLMASLGLISKFNPNPTMLKELRSAGRASADAFLGTCGEHVGKRGSVDMKREVVRPFLAPR